MTGYVEPSPNNMFAIWAGQEIGRMSTSQTRERYRKSLIMLRKDGTACE